MTFNDFALRPEILQAVADAGYEIPTPIQQQAIPIILTGSDLLGIAQTGTGKTAAFVLPMIERLASGRAKARMPRSLILSPTRELATQTANYFATYGKHLQLTMALLIGGVGMDEQWRLLERGVDVLIATPGRLLDQFERGKVLLGGVTILVIDEADRMLDMGFMPDVERIVGLVSRNRQTLMFSATMPPEIRRLADAFLTDPKEVQATPPATTAAGVEDHVTVVPARDKFQALRRLIETQEVDKALIFCNRKREVASLRRRLERAGLNVRDIHGDLEQSQRTQALDAFKRGEIDFLVATDVAARGLDIVSLPCVINYDVPTHADDYVHRVGRTGRAGQEGRAFTLILPEERRYVDAITRLTGKDIPRLELPGVETANGEAPTPRRRARSNGEAATARRGVARNGASVRPDSPPSAESEPAARAPVGRRRNGGRVERASAKPAPAEPDLTTAAPAVPRPAPRARAERRPAPPPPARAPGPVVGMGDHVPLFMRRPVPNVELLPKLTDD
jgi:superfamily II DNA/RNA helicase